MSNESPLTEAAVELAALRRILDTLGAQIGTIDLMQGVVLRRMSRLETLLETARAEDAETHLALSEYLSRDRCEGSSSDCPPILPARG